MLEHDGLVVSRTAAGTRVADSAAVLPRSVIKQIRELVEEAIATHTDPYDVINVLRMILQARSDAPPPPNPTDNA
jgi:hypothetical protein